MGAEMDWKTRTHPLKPGDKVAYSTRFLQSISAYTGDLPFARGVIRSIDTLSAETQIAEIDWNTPDIPARVNVANLCRIANLGREV